MARTVDEVMNRELFSLRGDESPPQAIRYLLSLGVSGAPVLAADGHPTGVVSLKDLAGAPEDEPVANLMTTPAATIPERSEISTAAGQLADRGYHRLVAVDRQGRAVGIVTALDLLRGFMGKPAHHGDAFPHQDPETGLCWCDDHPLGLSHVDHAPEGAGVLALVWAGVGHRDLMIWAEEAESIRSRLIDLLSTPQSSPLDQILRRADLRFRAARELDPVRRSRAVAMLRDQIQATWPWEQGKPF